MSIKEEELVEILDLLRLHSRFIIWCGKQKRTEILKSDRHGFEYLF